MTANAAFLGIFVIVAVIFPFLAFTLARFISPNRPNPQKATTYESGMTPRSGAWVRYRAPYFVYALMFVLFDVEAALLYPWAVAYNRLGIFALLEGFIFVGLLFLGLLYAWRKGDLRWT